MRRFACINWGAFCGGVAGVVIDMGLGQSFLKRAWHPLTSTRDVTTFLAACDTIEERHALHMLTTL